MSIQPLDLTSALRPVLLPDEILLFVQDAIGLYQGQNKVPEQQNGQAYLTSHRICYVDVLETRKNSVAIDLKGVEKTEFYAGFLKASPKITVLPKTTREYSKGRATGVDAFNSYGGTPLLPGSPFSVPARSNNTSITPSRSNTPNTTSATWVCPICGFPNALASNFDVTTVGVHSTLPACSTCGVKPPLALILKVAVASASGRNDSRSAIEASPKKPVRSLEDDLLSRQGAAQIRSNVGRSDTNLSNSKTSSDILAQHFEPSNQCPQCTFNNHPSMLACELCGTRLPQAGRVRQSQEHGGTPRQDSPGPVSQATRTLDITSNEPIKLSFRAGGAQIFHEKLKSALSQRKWLLHNAPPVPKASRSHTSPQRLISEPRKQVGIASLELSRETQRKANELTLTTSFADLSALMASAKDILALAESFAASSGTTSSDAKSANALLQESAAALGMVTTRNILGSAPSDTTGSELYISELSRSLAELLTDDTSWGGGGILKREGGIMSTIDLWAVVNRSRGGLESITPQDFSAATLLWEKLQLPVRLRRFKNGIGVVQRRDWTDEKTVGMLLAWLAELHHDHHHDHDHHPTATAIDSAIAVEQQQQSSYQSYWGRPISAHSTAQHFGWSLGVASEELEMAEEGGALCREETVEGVVYWENWIVWGDGDGDGEDDADAEGDGYNKQTVVLAAAADDVGSTRVIEENLRNVGIL